MWSALSSIPTKISELASSVGKFFSNFWESFTKGLSDLGKSIGEFFNGLGSAIGGFFSDLWTNIGNFFSGMVENIGNMWNWFTNFFENLMLFVYHIFIPTDEQWDALKEDFNDLSNAFNNHVPFVTFFSDEVEKVKQQVFNEDFLDIKMSGWKFDLGIIHYETADFEFTNVLKAYEPYRMSIRTLLTFVVYAMAMVYIIKHFVKYGSTQGLQNVDSSINSKGGTDK